MTDEQMREGVMKAVEKMNADRKMVAEMIRDNHGKSPEWLAGLIVQAMVEDWSKNIKC